jgi:NAD(P)H-dependent FMN reductase
MQRLFNGYCNCKKKLSAMDTVISIIYGSVRSQRKGIVAARYLEKKLRERNNVTIHFMDPMEYKLPLLDKMYKEYDPDNAPEPMRQLSDKLKNSDGFLMVTGEYNHGIPPALKNLLDHFQKEYFFKPSAIACYSTGIFGGVRAAIQLRSVVAELGMPAISSLLPFPKIASLFDEDLNPTQDWVEKSTAKFLDEFLWYTEALKNQRKKGTPY